jgi:hypothetical protein
MARILRLNDDTEKSKLIVILQKAVQSAHLNFLIGSGCSTPVVPTLGNIEKKIQELIDADKTDDAEAEIFSYLGTFLMSYEKLSISSDALTKKVIMIMCCS